MSMGTVDSAGGQEVLDSARGEKVLGQYKDAYAQRKWVIKKSVGSTADFQADKSKYFEDQLSLNATILGENVGELEQNTLHKQIFSKSYRIKWKILGLVRDFRACFWLLRRRGFTDAVNFAYTKLIVPTGEGSGRLITGLRPVRWLIRKFATKIPVPNFIELEPTTVCNKQCIHCEYTYWSPHEQVKRHVTLDEYQHIAKQLPKLRWTNITGEGSAFLNKDYVKMFQWLYNEHRTSIWLVDHLTDIDFSKLENDILPYIHGIYVSIDGATKETYEKIKVGCEWDKLIDNLTKIVEYKKRNKTPFPQITFRYVIMKENVGEVVEFVDLVNRVAPPDVWGGSSTCIEFTGLLYYPEVAKHYVRNLPREMLDGLKRRATLDGIRLALTHSEEKSNPPCETCDAWLEPYIMNPGYVMPCCSVMMSNRRPFLRKYAFGNVLEGNFKKIWNSPYYQKFKELLTNPEAPVPKICAGCRAYRTDHRIKKYGVWDVYEDDNIANPDQGAEPKLNVTLQKH